MVRRQKKGNYTREDRELILKAANSRTCGASIAEKQTWLLGQGVHRPGCPGEPVSESAIKYWEAAHRRIAMNAQNSYDEMIDRLLTSPPSYSTLKVMLAEKEE